MFFKVFPKQCYVIIYAYNTGTVLYYLVIVHLVDILGHLKIQRKFTSLSVCMLLLLMSGLPKKVLEAYIHTAMSSILLGSLQGLMRGLRRPYSFRYTHSYVLPYTPSTPSFLYCSLCSGTCFRQTVPWFSFSLIFQAATTLLHRLDPGLAATVISLDILVRKLGVSPKEANVW